MVLQNKQTFEPFESEKERRAARRPIEMPTRLVGTHTHSECASANRSSWPTCQSLVSNSGKHIGLSFLHHLAPSFFLRHSPVSLHLEPDASQHAAASTNSGGCSVGRDPERVVSRQPDHVQPSACSSSCPATPTSPPPPSPSLLAPSAQPCVNAFFANCSWSNRNLCAQPPPRAIPSSSTAQPRPLAARFAPTS
jgi:hypothetical protein